MQQLRLWVALLSGVLTVLLLIMSAICCVAWCLVRVTAVVACPHGVPCWLAQQAWGSNAPLVQPCRRCCPALRIQPAISLTNWDCAAFVMACVCMTVASMGLMPCRQWHMWHGGSCVNRHAVSAGCSGAWIVIVGMPRVLLICMW